MTILFRYLLRQNVFLLFTILLVATGIYLLGDLFDRMDTFLESGIGLLSVLAYFVVKLPNIISQLLPAVFLIALVIQLNILSRTNEMVALLAGGISPLVIMRFILFYGLVWACIQLGFSQMLGVEGDRYARTMWKEQVRGKELDGEVYGLWFTEKNFVVHLDNASPDKGTGKGLLVYELSEDGLSFTTIIQATSFTIQRRHWELYDGAIAKPASYSREAFATHRLPIRQDLKAFGAMEMLKEPTVLPLWELGKVISRLKEAGSNVEAYRVAWHAKLAYAASIMVMGLFALAISQLTPNIYKAVGYSLVVIFLFYAVNKMVSTLGEQGAVNPAVAAWFADGFAFLIGLCWLLWPAIRQKR